MNCPGPLSSRFAPPPVPPSLGGLQAVCSLTSSSRAVVNDRPHPVDDEDHQTDAARAEAEGSVRFPGAQPRFVRLRARLVSVCMSVAISLGHALTSGV